MELDKGGQGNRSTDTTGSSPTLKDLGVTKDQSSNSQRIAAIPEDVFEGFGLPRLLLSRVPSTVQTRPAPLTLRTCCSLVLYGVSESIDRVLIESDPLGVG
jgi:hypothetical protein